MRLVAAVPQCRTAVATVNGYECVIIDADIQSDDVKFDNLVDVVDPRNWPMSYPSFFCRCGGRRDRGDDWWDVKETAGFCNIDGGLKFVTKLRFIKTNQRNYDYRLDFDLAEPDRAATAGSWSTAALSTCSAPT